MNDLTPKIETIWVCSVVLQHPETFEMFHAMGQFVDFTEEGPKQMTIRIAMKDKQDYTLVSCRAIPVSTEAIKALGFVRVRNSAPTQEEVQAEQAFKAQQIDKGAGG